MKRLAVVCDLAEENWPSMDLVASQLLDSLRRDHAGAVEAAKVQPAMVRRFTRLPLLGRGMSAFNADRLLNRMLDYPRHLARRAGSFDLFHICDHSYAQLVHVLPAARTGVFCHDLDTFRCLLEPEKEPRSAPFKAMARRILSGLRKAAVVFHTTRAVRAEIERHGLVDPARLVLAPCGVSPAFTPQGPAQEPAEAALAPLGGAPYLLHVGSGIARKRIDVLLRVFAGLRSRLPDLRLVQFGGSWSASQKEELTSLGILGSTLQLSGRDELFAASLYRKAALVLMPSESEGFGIPVAEALACGRVVLASDIPVLREVGGDAAVYRPVGDVHAWVETASRLLGGEGAPALAARLAQARRYSWPEHARIILDAYRSLR